VDAAVGVDDQHVLGPTRPPGDRRHEQLAELIGKRPDARARRQRRGVPQHRLALVVERRDDGVVGQQRDVPAGARRAAPQPAPRRSRRRAYKVAPAIT
jgi:hypothetical protein